MISLTFPTVTSLFRVNSSRNMVGSTTKKVIGIQSQSRMELSAAAGSGGAGLDIAAGSGEAGLDIAAGAMRAVGVRGGAEPSQRWLSEMN